MATEPSIGASAEGLRRQPHGRLLHVGSSTGIRVANVFSFSNGWPKKSILTRYVLMSSVAQRFTVLRTRVVRFVGQTKIKEPDFSFRIKTDVLRL
jgi:hypothetical protein